MSGEEEKLIRIKRIQRKFQEDLNPEQKLKYLRYLSDITISLDILKETSIGKIVNLMRKEDGIIGQLAGELVSRWKKIVDPTSSKQQTVDTNKYNKKIDNNSVKQNSNYSINCSKLTNGTLKTKREGNSSSSPCKPKISEEEKPKKQKNISSAHNKNTFLDPVQDEQQSTSSSYLKDEHSSKYIKNELSNKYIKSESYIKDEEPLFNSEDIKLEPSYDYDDYDYGESPIESKYIKNELDESFIKSEPMDDESLIHKTDSASASSSKSKNEKLNPKKDKSLKNEKIVKDDSPSKADTDNTEAPKKKQSKSFEEMLMMPIFPTKKKKKKKKEDTTKVKNREKSTDLNQVKNREKSTDLNQLRLLDIPKKLPKLPTLPDVELPQINTVPVYRPSRPLPSSLGIEEPKKKAVAVPAAVAPPAPVIPEPPPPTLCFADITSRKTKSVMFSGKKAANNGVVVSLYQMCMRILCENVDALYETGGVPFSVLEPLLTKCSPAQLERLEYYNAHFIQDTDHLWKKHCQIEFRGKKIDEDAVGAWRDMYKELYTEREVKLQRLSNKIQYNQTQKAPERSVKLAFVATAPKPSAQVLRVQKRKEKQRDIKKNEKEKEDEERREKQREIRERMMKEQQEESDVHVPFTKVPKRDRCSKRPPTSLSSSASNLHPESKKPREAKEEEELGSVAPPEFTPTPVKKKKGKNPMMLKALKLLNKQKSRMGAQIMRK